MKVDTDLNACVNIHDLLPPWSQNASVNNVQGFELKITGQSYSISKYKWLHKLARDQNMTFHLSSRKRGVRRKIIHQSLTHRLTKGKAQTEQ